MTNQTLFNDHLQTELRELSKVYGALKASCKKDIVRDKQEKNALAASETRYRRLFETAKDGILILDAETGMIVDVNPFLIELLGYSKEQFLEKAIWEIGFFKDKIANKDNFLELQQNDYIRYADMPLETAHGRKINVEFVSNVYLVNSQKVIQCNIRDITERTMTENRIKLSSQILNLLNTAIPFAETIEHIISLIQGAFGFDAIGIRVKNGDDYPYYSQYGFSDSFLQTENTLIERTREGGICTDNNGKPCLECTCGLVITGKIDSTNPLFTEGGSFWTNDSQVLLALTADQEPRHNPRNRCIHDGYQSFAIIPIRHNAEIVGLLQINDRKKDCFTPTTIKFFESIGETIGVALLRKQAGDEILTLNESLERRIVERTKQLETSNKELAFHLSELEQFSYVSNHDLQEPLRSLIQFTCLLKDNYSDKLDEEGKRYIGFISTSAVRMKELVKDLFEYSLLGKESIKATIECNKTVDTVIFDLDDSIHKSGAKITYQQLPIIIGYETELRLLFQNLIANAIKYQKQDNVPKINISAESRNNEWLFKISDNGIGIDKKYKDKIFIIFQRLHKRSEYEGTGIGLAHCKKVVEMHGGKIWVESTPAGGSNFMFTIPKN